MVLVHGQGLLDLLCLGTSSSVGTGGEGGSALGSPCTAGAVP